MIRKNEKFSVGDIVRHDGKRCKIISFPTRYFVCVENLEYKSSDFFTAKISVRDIENDIKERDKNG